jgi:predicted signal transduction protein with EAL and GGDEF domain
MNDLGLEIAMDDFGPGSSSLSSLTKVPFQKIKIDRSFVRDLAISPEARAILATIVELARTLGMRTTAEGIETARYRQAMRMYAVSCSAALFSRNVRAEKLVGRRSEVTPGMASRPIRLNGFEFRFEQIRFVRVNLTIKTLDNPVAFLSAPSTVGSNDQKRL